jgi:hypothetical protein
MGFKMKNVGSSVATVAKASAVNPLLGSAAALSEGKRALGVGGGKKSDPSAPRPADNWWEKDRPTERYQFTDPDGNLKGNFKLNAPASRLGELDSRMGGVAPVNYYNAGNTAALANTGMLNARAYNPNASEGALAQNRAIDLQTSNMIDKNNQANNGALLNARRDLAASGGMSGGARERLGMSGMRDRMMANAGAYSQGAGQKAGVLANDWQQKHALQEKLPGMYQNLGQNQLQTDQFNAGLGMDKVNAWRNQAGAEDTRAMDASKVNIGNAMQDKAADTNFAMDKWKTQNQIMGGQYTADSQNYYAKQQANKGLLGNQGGILGTGINIF